MCGMPACNCAERAAERARGGDPLAARYPNLATWLETAPAEVLAELQDFLRERVTSAVREEVSKLRR